MDGISSPVRRVGVAAFAPPYKHKLLRIGEYAEDLQSCEGSPLVEFGLPQELIDGLKQAVNEGTKEVAKYLQEEE